MALLTERLAATFALMTALPLARPETRVTTAQPALFPVVGLALGLALLALDAALGLVLPDLTASAVLVLALAVMTGGMHLDGLADSADGLFGGRDAPSRLRIMEDPRNGAFGFIAVAMALLLEFSAIASLDESLRAGTLALFPLLARTSVLWAIEFAPAARSTGMGSETARCGMPYLLALTIAAAVGASVVFVPAGALLLLAGILTTGFITMYSIRRVGGLTGDIMGAVIEVSGVVVLLLAASSVETGWLS